MTTPQKNDPTLPKWAQQKNQPASPQPQRAAVAQTILPRTSVVSGDARAKKNVAAWVLLGVVVLLGVGLIGLASINGDYISCSSRGNGSAKPDLIIARHANGATHSRHWHNV